jgi:predicted  nucleic acid-binding Zn-ribbon protein
MKLKFLLLTISVIPFLGLRGQGPITLEDDTISIGNSSMPGFSVGIPEVGYNETLRSWTKLLESGTRSKAVVEGETISIFGAKIKKVSDNPVNIYSRLWDADTAMSLNVAVELSKDVYTGNAERSEVRKYLFDFAKGQYVDLATRQLKAEEKILADLKKGLGSLEKNKSKMEKRISKNNDLISKERDRLIVLNNELSVLSPGMASEGEYADEDPDAVKDREKEIKKKNREIRAAENKISKAEREIRANKESIPDNMDEQVDARNRVSEQEAIVKEYERKLDTIKDYEL